MQYQIFKYEEEEDILSQVRTIEIDGEIWFIASDVAKILGYKEPHKAVDRHCKRGTKHPVLDNQGVMQNTWIIPEPDIYRLIISSKLPSASKFEDWVFEEVIPAIRNKGYYGKIERVDLPNFILRYEQNMHKIDRNYFSVISEMFVRLYKELEKHGYVMPEKSSITGKQMTPDISVGITFAKYLKGMDSEHYGTHKKYIHTFHDGREVKANMYHINALPDFIRFIHEIWIPKYAENYFKKRDPKALDYLQKLLEGPK